MENTRSPYTTAGYFFYLSSALHVVAIAVSAGALFGTLIAAVFLWALVGYGLINRPRRWLAHLGFIGALVGIVASTSLLPLNTGITWLSLLGIALADLGAAVVLFGSLWRKPA